MVQFEVREIKKNDRFYSETKYTYYNKNSIIGKFLNFFGLPDKHIESKIKCSDNIVLSESDIKKYLQTVDKDNTIIIVAIHDGKIIGLLHFVMSLYNSIIEKRIDMMISNTILCFEKDIMNLKDIEKFVNESLLLVEKFYNPQYKKLFNTIKNDQEYIHYALPNMFIYLLTNNKNIKSIYKNCGFFKISTDGNLLMLVLKKPEEQVWFIKGGDVNNRERVSTSTLSLSKGKSRSRSRSRSKK